MRAANKELGRRRQQNPRQQPWPGLQDLLKQCASHKSPCTINASRALFAYHYHNHFHSRSQSECEFQFLLLAWGTIKKSTLESVSQSAFIMRIRGKSCLSFSVFSLEVGRLCISDKRLGRPKANFCTHKRRNNQALGIIKSICRRAFVWTAWFLAIVINNLRIFIFGQPQGGISVWVAITKTQVAAIQACTYVCVHSLFSCPLFRPFFFFFALAKLSPKRLSSIQRCIYFSARRQNISAGPAVNLLEFQSYLFIFNFSSSPPALSIIQCHYYQASHCCLPEPLFSW